MYVLIVSTPQVHKGMHFQAFIQIQFGQYPRNNYCYNNNHLHVIEALLHSCLHEHSLQHFWKHIKKIEKKYLHCKDKFCDPSYLLDTFEWIIPLSSFRKKSSRKKRPLKLHIHDFYIVFCGLVYQKELLPMIKTMQKQENLSTNKTIRTRA